MTTFSCDETSCYRTTTHLTETIEKTENVTSKVGKFRQINVIYSIPCKERATCVGHAGCRSGICTNENEEDYENLHKTGGMTAIITHAVHMEKDLKKEHTPDFDSIAILDKEPDPTKIPFSLFSRSLLHSKAKLFTDLLSKRHRSKHGTLYRSSQRNLKNI